MFGINLHAKIAEDNIFLVRDGELLLWAGNKAEGWIIKFGLFHNIWQDYRKYYEDAAVIKSSNTSFKKQLCPLTYKTFIYIGIGKLPLGQAFGCEPHRV